jgi:hypothetical protein
MDVRLYDSKVNKFVEKKIQWYLGEMNSENIYIENVKNKKIVWALSLKDSRYIYNSWILSFYTDEGLKCNLIIVIFWVVL